MEQRQIDAAIEAVGSSRLTQVAADFAGQIATAVWLRRLTDEAAREALGSYALACAATGPARERMGAALLSEYRRRRERQDACS